MDESLVYLNGKLVKKSEALVSVFDHGFLYGDGVFEGIRVYEGIIFKLREHIERLFNSANYIHLDLPLSKKEMIESVVRTVAANKLRDAYVRVVVSRGQGDLGIDPMLCSEPNVVIIAEKMQSTLSSDLPRTVSAMISSFRRDRVDATSHEVKSLNYLNSILAKIEASSNGYDDAIMLDSRGYVSEATVTNVFIVKNGEVSTPSTASGILHGITRKRVIELCNEKGINVSERDVTPFELLNADEVFLTGTKTEIASVVKINGRKIGRGRVGKLTLSLFRRFREIVRSKQEGEPVTK